MIYMHRVSDVRMDVARGSFRLFKRLCGDMTMRNVAIVTTMWSHPAKKIELKREHELESTSGFFGDAIAQRTRMYQHDRTKESGRHILDSLLGNRSTVFRVQSEIVDEQTAPRHRGWHRISALAWSTRTDTSQRAGLQNQSKRESSHEVLVEELLKKLSSSWIGCDQRKNWRRTRQKTWRS
ncbi:hypothetical protein AcW1_008040 [Taiwanofungus camphoratus]|nr:hypothetical protein AcW1_008040 [Antrodia cinnamomea]